MMKIAFKRFKQHIKIKNGNEYDNDEKNLEILKLTRLTNRHKANKC